MKHSSLGSSSPQSVFFNDLPSAEAFFHRYSATNKALRPERERNGNYRHGARTKETLEAARLIKALAGVD
jgi:hypothetical protein